MGSDGQQPVPWLVSFRDMDGIHKCGDMLIKSNVVLTIDQQQTISLNLTNISWPEKLEYFTSIIELQLLDKSLDKPGTCEWILSTKKTGFSSNSQGIKVCRIVPAGCDHEVE